MSSYYSRNRTARLEYRAQNAFIKGPGRRKVGKAKQQASEERRRAELSGERILYKTRLVSRPNSKDGERTTAMAYDEAKLLQDLTEQKAAFQSAYLHEWQRPYTLLLERRIKEFVADAESFIASLPKNRQGWPEEDRSIVHGYRRLAAGCAQEIELCALGIGIYAQVEEDGIFILKGSHVNRSTFKSLYGF